MVELKLKGLAERGKPDPGSAHTADSGGHNPSLLGQRWVNVSFRVADEMFWLTIAPFCWLGERAHEALKELLPTSWRHYNGAQIKCQAPRLQD
jgi:hypothetical protein